jgi:hypothetical protein
MRPAACQRDEVIEVDLTRRAPLTARMAARAVSFDDVGPRHALLALADLPRRLARRIVSRLIARLRAVRRIGPHPPRHIAPAVQTPALGLRDEPLRLLPLSAVLLLAAPRAEHPRLGRPPSGDDQRVAAPVARPLGRGTAHLLTVARTAPRPTLATRRRWKAVERHVLLTVGAALHDIPSIRRSVPQAPYRRSSPRRRSSGPT